MKLRHFWNHLMGKTTAERPAKLTLANVKGVAQSMMRRMGGFDMPQHIYEQIIWRRTQVHFNSPMCWYSGKCKVCGCDILGKTMEDRACSISEHPDLLAKRKPCYPEMMEEKEWEIYKDQNKIKLFK